MLNSLLNNTQKQIVGVCLTPGIGLEAVVYDKGKNIALKYGRKKVEYNFSTREIQDYVEFKSALSDLMQEMNVAPKAPAFLVLPNVHFDFIDIPTAVSDSEIKTVLLSKAEEFYLFKKEEPVSGWCYVSSIDPTQKRLAYTSFQKNAVENLKDIFTDVGLQLIGIESAYSATIRGLYSIGAIDDVISRGESWTAMLVNTNSYTLMQFDADNLVQCNEVPIAIKSFSTEEAYGAIASSASQLLDNFAISKLYIVSQTDDICAEVLKNQLQFSKEIIAIDTNKYSKKPIVEVLQSTDFKKANALTLSVIGGSNIKTDFGLTINVMADDPSSNLGVYFTTSIFGMTVDVTSEIAVKLCMALAIFFLIIFGVIALALKLIGTGFENKISDISTEISNIDKIIAAESTNEEKQEVDMNQIIDQVAQVNVQAIKYYDSIASDIPKNIWLTKYYNQNGDKVVIRGVAENIIDIYEYFKNLKIVSPESDIKLNDLKVLADNNESDAEFLKDLYNINKSRLYSFEISNTAINYQKPDEQNKAEEDVIIRPAGGEEVEQLSNQVQPAQ